MASWVDLGGWSHTEINIPYLELNPDAVTHLSTDRVRRWLTSLTEANALTTTPDHQPCTLTNVCTYTCNQIDWVSGVVRKSQSVFLGPLIFLPSVASPAMGHPHVWCRWHANLRVLLFIWSIDREFEFYDFFSFLKFNEFYEFFSVEKLRKKFVIL